MSSSLAGKSSVVTSTTTATARQVLDTDMELLQWLRSVSGASQDQVKSVVVVTNLLGSAIIIYLETIYLFTKCRVL
jgi:hypothetical protein